MKDGGPAFPIQGVKRNDVGEIEDIRYCKGMSLRDWFAGMTLAGYKLKKGISRDNSAGAIASWAYEIADAMLEEREKTEEEKK